MSAPTARGHSPPSTADNPFATPALDPELPAFPKQVAQRTPKSPHPHPLATNDLYYGARDRSESDAVDAGYKSASLSSANDSFMVSPISSVDEKRSIGRDSQSRKKPTRSSRDPEKAGYSPDRRSRQSAERRTSAAHVAYAVDDDMEEETRRRQEEKAGNILVFLAMPCVALSVLNAVWTLISLLITLCTQPVRLCARRPSFGQQLGGLLGPALNLQLKSIYTPLPPHADEDTSYNACMLVVVQLLSPFFSMGFMVAAWVVAVFWFASAVVGDPSGTDKRDDGKETVLMLRGWWEHWLIRGVRQG